MSKTYNPGPAADVIVERQLAKGNYGSADEVVRAGLRLLEEHEAELEELRKLIGSTAASRTSRPSRPAPLMSVQPLGDKLARADLIAYLSI